MEQGENQRIKNASEYFKKKKFTNGFLNAKVIADFERIILIEWLSKQEMIYGESKYRKLF